MLFIAIHPQGSFGDANYFAANALAVLPVAYYLGRYTTGRLHRAFGWGSALLLLLSIVLSQSRGGMLGLGGIILLVIYESRSRVRVVASLAVVVALVLLLSPVNPLKRFLEPSTGEKISTDSHLMLIQAGLRMIRAEPIFGIGMGQFKLRSTEYVDGLPRAHIAHNSYLELAAENGLPALLFFLALAKTVFTDFSRVREAYADDILLSALAQGLRLGWIGFLVSATFVSAEYEKTAWVICFLAMALAVHGFVPADVTGGDIQGFSEDGTPDATPQIRGFTGSPV